MAELSQLPGDKAAAILLTLLPDDAASAIIGTFAPDQLRRVGGAMLEVRHSTAAEIETALDLFVERNRAMSGLGLDASPRFHALLTSAVGDRQANALIAEIAPPSPASISATLQWFPPAVVLAAINGEQPQTAALILASLSPEAAAEALEQLDEERQADLLYRAARLEHVSVQAVEGLQQILTAYGDSVAPLPPVEIGGRSGAAKIATKLSRGTNEKLLKRLRKRDKELAQAVEDELLVFDDLLALDAKNMGLLLRTVDTETLTLALRGASAAAVDKMLGCLSGRAADTIRDEIASGAPVKRTEVEEAQREVAATARQLAQAGELMLAGSGDDYV